MPSLMAAPFSKCSSSSAVGCHNVHIKFTSAPANLPGVSITAIVKQSCSEIPDGGPMSLVVCLDFK